MVDMYNEHGARQSHTALFLDSPEFPIHLGLFRDKITTSKADVLCFYSRLDKGVVVDEFLIRSDDGDYLVVGDTRQSGWIERLEKEDVRAYFLTIRRLRLDTPSSQESTQRTSYWPKLVSSRESLQYL
jgi:hypothetical protein